MTSRKRNSMAYAFRHSIAKFLSDDCMTHAASLSLAGILVAVTGLVTALQSSLNTVWKVKPLDGAFATRFLWKRFVSLVMILGFGFLSLVSFLVSTILAALTDYVSSYFTLSGIIPRLLNQAVSLLTTWAFFTSTFRWMQDARVPWPHAALGGLLTVVFYDRPRGIVLLPFVNPSRSLTRFCGWLTSSNLALDLLLLEHPALRCRIHGFAHSVCNRS